MPLSIKCIVNSFADRPTDEPLYSGAPERSGEHIYCHGKATDVVSQYGVVFTDSLRFFSCCSGVYGFGGAGGGSSRCDKWEDLQSIREGIQACCK
jgi:hypothetical protein